MKKIKWLSYLLAVLMLLTVFASCGEDEVYSVPTGREGFATNTDEFDTKISKLIDVAKYKRTESDDGDEIGYTIIENKYSAKLNYKVTFADGQSITVPTTLEKIKKAGWTTESAEDKKIDNKSSLFIYAETFKNSKGEQIYLYPENLIDRSENGTVELPLSECDFTTVQITLNESDGRDNGVLKYKQAEGATVFKCGNIDNYSTIKEVIKAVGEPKSITYIADNNNIMLEFEKLDDKMSTLSIEFVADGDYIESFTLRNYNGTIN